ncbi:MAG TPA: PIG-L family deacetylase [Bryobacteraceae bacterium]|nr:PIG-L family deacetylase [Bryobacteraceae bacterium]
MNILAFGPHPDDVEFGCAPVLIKEVENGNRVKIVVLSRGEAGTSGTPEGREQEARAAAKLIGAGIDFLDLGGDCHIAQRPENTIRLAGEIRNEKPDVVLAPSPAENQHPDHVAVSAMVRAACRLARYGGLAELRSLPPHKIGSLLFYNITSHLGSAPDFVIDVSGVAEKWEAVMRCHASQVASKSYLDLQLSAAGTLGLLAGVELAIGLYKNDPIRVSDLSVVARSAREF